MKHKPVYVVNRFTSMILYKRGQGISMNTIVIAAIALVVLLVVLFIFNQKIGVFGSGISTCAGSCVSKGTSSNGYQACQSNNMAYSPQGNKECGENIYCCIKVNSS